MSIRFTLGLHILVHLELMKDSKVTSEILGRSVGTHPARIRQIYRLLGQAGLVKGRRRGGTVLGRPAGEITLYDVFNAVGEAETRIVPIHSPQTIACPLGFSVFNILNRTIVSLDQVFRDELNKTTIAQLAGETGRERTE